MANEKLNITRIAPSEYTNTSRIIHKGPCIIKSVHVTGGSGNSSCKVYDGQNATGELKADIRVVVDSSYTWRPGDGTDFDYGIYIVVSSSDTYVTVTFIPESRKAFI